MRLLPFQFGPQHEQELKAFMRENKNVREFRRAQLVIAVVRGRRMDQVALDYDTGYSGIRKWVHRYHHQGLDGLKDRPRAGRPTILSDEERAFIHKYGKGGTMSNQALRLAMVAKFGYQGTAETIRRVRGPQGPPRPRKARKRKAG